MRRCLLVVALAVALVGCGTGTAPVTTGATTAAPVETTSSGGTGESRDVSGFTGVELTSVGDLRIEQTGTESLTVEAAPDVLPQLTSEVLNGVLRLGVTPGATIETDVPIVYRLTVAALDSLTVSGSGDATAPALTADRLTVDISGAGDVTLGGTVDAQVVTITGAGDYDAEGLQSATAEITIDGAGDAVVRVADRLDATVGGVGSVEYIGDPQVTEDVDGVGSVERR
jgi:Putative auto-transporter adhesin, head GIN domain